MDNPRKRPTMREVARQANVSIQTVSAVINNKPGITSLTRERVLMVIKELSYRPYSIGQSLRTGQTHTLALIVSDIANPSFSAMASAAEDYAHNRGYSLIVYNTHDDIAREARYVDIISQRWIDGVLFVSAEDKMTSLDAFRSAGIPAVAIDRIPEGYAGVSVTLDNVKAGRMAAEHLLDLGHRRISHISGPLRLRLARERRLGFELALQERGLQPAVCTGGEGHWEFESGYRAMQEILACQKPPSGVFAANDRMAIGAMRAIVDAGWSVPDDISIVGLDDIEASAYQQPPLTTVRQSFAELATRAIELLLAVLAGQEPATNQVMIEPRLVVRQSTAACKAIRPREEVIG